MENQQEPTRQQEVSYLKRRLLIAFIISSLVSGICFVFKGTLTQMLSWIFSGGTLVTMANLVNAIMMIIGVVGIAVAITSILGYLYFSTSGKYGVDD